MRVSVVGGSRTDASGERTARELGRRLGERDHTLVCGGLGGVMAAACRGARERDAHTVGILPGEDPRAANDAVETAVATGLGHARNALVVLNGDAVVAVDGASGTLTELGFAGVYDRPAAGVDTHEVEWVEPVDSPREAVEYVEREAGEGPAGQT
jgi:uncharacterized protein (TIGR00725 family)